MRENGLDRRRRATTSRAGSSGRSPWVDSEAIGLIWVDGIARGMEYESATALQDIIERLNAARWETASLQDKVATLIARNATTAKRAHAVLDLVIHMAGRP